MLCLCTAVNPRHDFFCVTASAGGDGAGDDADEPIEIDDDDDNDDNFSDVSDVSGLSGLSDLSGEETWAAKPTGVIIIIIHRLLLSLAIL